MPVIPLFFFHGVVATTASLISSGAALTAVGAATSLFTGRTALFSAFRQLVIGALAAGVTYGMGSLAGVALG